MEPRRVVNPKVLLPLAGLVLVVTSAIGIYIAAGCSPDSTSVVTTSTAPATPVGR